MGARQKRETFFFLEREIRTRSERLYNDYSPVTYFGRHTPKFQILTFLSTVTYLLAASLRLVRYHYLLVVSYFLYFKFVTFNF